MSGAAGLLAAGLLLLGAAGLTGLGRGAAGPTPPMRQGEAAADPSLPPRQGEPWAALSRPQRFALTESARRVLAALPYLLGCAGSACLAVAGGAAVAGHGSVLDLGDLLGLRGVRLARPMLWLVREAKRLQSGRLDAYLGYMLIALVAVIAVVAALS
jgi:hypothetical protein